MNRYEKLNRLEDLNTVLDGRTRLSENVEYTLLQEAMKLADDLGFPTTRFHQLALRIERKREDELKQAEQAYLNKDYSTYMEVMFG